MTEKQENVITTLASVVVILVCAITALVGLRVQDTGGNTWVNSRAPYKDTTVLITAPAPAPARTPLSGVQVNQGDVLWAPLENNKGAHAACTAGFVDKLHRRVWVAAHCGYEGAPVTTGTGDFVGVFHMARYSMSQVYSREVLAVTYDYAYIQLFDNITPGHNSFSGNRLLSILEVSRGDTACWYGTTSKQVGCGTVDEITGGRMTFTPDDTTRANARPGDSGGPVWVEGKGFVGVLHGILLNNQGDQYVEGIPVHRVLGVKIPTQCITVGEDCTPGA